ncbi:nucleoside recognition domain-containing protein [Deminuibacter soli]|uniref:Nucleoside transporter/FeoB GTPase Gate domain-containing protein n=1 Tax=Deminuibacter soli TaxID=2291815 RepID=A0A3E1NGN3_9BACT|nr:nucleoside recognition domain-containing protein [Deminuibacter soli]RFM27109.1 hypothetical protein DXN05_16725 [Deminuibacter soli]
MALNIVWVGFFVIGFAVALCKFAFLHDNAIFQVLVEKMFDTAKIAVMDVSLPLAGTMVFFLGIMNIAEKAGGVNWLARRLNPLMKRLFPEVPDNHPAMGQMVMNFSANMLGLDNAATPFGLKAMESLQEMNPDKNKASNSQIMFLVLHASGLTLIPLSIIAYRVSMHSTQASSVFIPCVLGTVCTTLAGIFVLSFKQKLRWDSTLVLWLLALVGIVGLMMAGVGMMTPEQKENFSKVFGNLTLMVIIVGIILAGVFKKVAIFDTFIEGAKEGFGVVLQIIPYLTGMLVAISVFRYSGALDFMVQGITWLIHLTGINTEFTPALPVALMKPFSGGGARGLMLDVMKAYGPDSFAGKIACIFHGTADSTFYIIALYFGRVGIKNPRYAISAGLLTEFIGAVIAIFIGYIFFY